MSRYDKRAGRVKYKGKSSEDIDRAIYGKFAGHPCLKDLELALGLGVVVNEGEWSPKENFSKVETERNRAGFRVGQYLVAQLKRGNFAEVIRVNSMAKQLTEKRWGVVDPLAYEILRAREEWWRKNNTEPTPRNLLFLINQLRLKLGGPALKVSLGALTMKMRRIGVDLKGRKQKIGKRTG